MKKTAKKTKRASTPKQPGYLGLVKNVSDLLEAARHASARTINAFMTATYCEVGRQIVEFEQSGQKRAEYGNKLLERLSQDLTARFGRGFARPNLIRFRQFYQAFPKPALRPAAQNDSSATLPAIGSTPSTESSGAAIVHSVSAPFQLAELARAFPLLWSHYVLLISRSRSPGAFTYTPSGELAGLRKAPDLFGKQLTKRPGELSEVLVA